MTAFRVPLRVAAVCAVAAVVGTTAAFPAAAAEDGVEVINTETVQVYTSPSGEVESQRIYEQLALTGDGHVTLVNPVSTDGLRNLDGFGGFEVRDGQQVAELTVDGEQRLRSVSDYSGDLPLDVSVEYRLDGELVDPSDVVGESGELEVEFTVKNVTGVPQEVSFADGNGGTVTKTVDVPIPMVGSLTTTTPASFTDVQSKSANMAGDGKGGTKLSFTMTLFPPIGSDTARFGYTATISDGVVPEASISALPVNPLASPTFASAAESYQGGATTGVELANGAATIDENLLKLRDGAADLLAGLIQLRDGAVQLEAGLAGEAAPGAQLLADGAAELNEGLGEIGSGAQQLSDGAGEARSGSEKLTSGLGQISDGLGQLADTTSGLPAAADGIDQLKAGVDLIITRVGTVEEAETLVGGLTKLESGLTTLHVGTGNLRGGLGVLAGQAPETSPGLPGAKAGVDLVQGGLAEAVKAGGTLDQLLGALALVKGTAGCSTDPVCAGTVGKLIPQVQGSKASLSAANQGLIQVSGGLAAAITALETQLLPGAGLIEAGIGQAKDGATRLSAGGAELRTGLQQVSAGLGQLDDGITAAVQGVLQLSSGAGEAHAGSAALTEGLGQLDDGAGQLADGAGQAADGSSQIADGAGELAEGLGEAAAGSGELAAGLGQAADGAPQLVDGAERLSDEGTSKLVDAGQATAQNYGEMYAVIQAGAERAEDEKMVYGAPEGALGLAAYSYEITGEDGEGGRNIARGLGALAVLAMGAGAFGLRRRLV